MDSLESFQVIIKLKNLVAPQLNYSLCFFLLSDVFLP